MVHLLQLPNQFFAPTLSNSCLFFLKKMSAIGHDDPQCPLISCQEKDKDDSPRVKAESAEQHPVVIQAAAAELAEAIR